MRGARTQKTKGRSPHTAPASSRRHTWFNFEAINRSYLSPLISTEMFLWALVFVLLLTCSAADPSADWPDEDEENAFKKDIAIDQLIISDFSRFHSQDRKWMKPNINPAFKFKNGESPVLNEDLAIPDDGLAYQRWKRDTVDIEDYSGDDPCDHRPCLEPGQTCVFNMSSPRNYHCACARGFEEVTTASNLTCAAVSADNLANVIGLSVGIPLFVIIALVIVFLVYQRGKRRKAIERNHSSDENQSNSSSTFSRLAIFGMFRNQGMYQPHNFSETSQEDKKYDHYRINSNDHSYSGSSPSTSRRTESKRLNTEEPANFSWDRFYQTSVPEEEFHIKRPQISTNPAYHI